LELLLNENLAILSSNQSPVGTGSLTLEAIPFPGIYRVEVAFDGPARAYVPSDKPFISTGAPPARPLAWLFSNPIVVGESTSAAASDPEPVLERVAIPPDARWVIEHAVGSSGEVAAEADGLRFGFRLGTHPAQNPYAALVAEVTGSATLHEIEFIGRAERATRISVQVRMPHADFRDGIRWRRSVYLDETPRHIRLKLTDLEAVSANTPRLRDLAHEIRSLLFVVDTVNSTPGAQGTVWISRVAMGRGK
jgi:hypothetical protein